MLTPPGQVIFLIGNKSDLDAQRDVTYEEAKQFAEENGRFVSCQMEILTVPPTCFTIIVL